ncbi:MAG: hypothetical protein JO013_07935 [Alphaproteobacteria bacterium]|nr:hypothetical protein [Alphaproteobacteria bacterium]
MSKRRTTGSAIDAGVSLLAAGSAAFVLYAMPEAVLARIFAACGLASFSPRFQPPFGAALRVGLVALGALVILAFVWSLMKALDRAPAAAAAAGDPVRLPEAEPDAPRLRKADAHPDAPPRRPLLAGRDLGEPLDLDPADALPQEADEAAEADEEFVPVPEPAAPAAEPVAAVPSFLIPQEEEEEEEETDEPAAEHAYEAPHEASPEPAPEAESIVALMHRFESGLVRKKQALADRTAVEPVPPPPAPPPLAASVPTAAPEPQPAGPAPVGHRLRSAIADLQKVAGR